MKTDASFELNTQESFYLKQLLVTGLWGSTLAEVLQRLLDDQLWQMLKEGRLVPAVVDTREKCIDCGSPNLEPVKAMGAARVRCQDCGITIPLSELHA
jgi:DNA-directed RNA polymerase subunit RPC12/RpoP